MTQPRSQASRVTPEEYRDVIGRFATGVTVITAIEHGRWYGATASAVSSLSLEPPMLLVCLNCESTTGAAVTRAGSFAVNILAESQDQLAQRFASRHPDKFEGVSIAQGERGHPLLEDALAHLECRVTEQVMGGTHTVFLAEVDRAFGRAGAPLAYFRGQFGRLSLSQDEQAHAVLRANIIKRAIVIDHPLDLPQLAEQLGVPQRSAQQALMRLRDEGLVRQQDDGSFVVVPLTVEMIDDTFRARLAVQLGAAALSVGRMSREQLRELRRYAERSTQLRPGEGSTDLEGFEIDQAFHEHLLRASGSGALVTAYRRLTVPGLMARSLGSVDAIGHDIAADRLAVVEAYEAGDLETACAAIRRAYERAIEFHRERVRRAGGFI